MKLFARDLQGEYCRLGPYEEDGEINLVVSHGAPVATTPVVDGDKEKIIPLRAVKYATLRYSPAEARLFIGGVVKAQQADLAEIFAKHVLGRPGFFSGKDARDLYTLDPISEAGPDFAFDYRYDDRILDVRIVAAAADHFEWDEDEAKWRVRPDLGIEGRNRRAAALQGQRGEVRQRLAARRDLVPRHSSNRRASGLRRSP